MKHTTPGYSGGETLAGADVSVPDASILNFWQWAYSDLLDNVTRGVFGEWLVAKLLGLTFEESRPSWQAWDIEMANSVRIEVKTSAYVHKWTPADTDDAAKPKKRSRIEFTNLRTKAFMDEAQTILADEPSYNADLYVFCMQIHELQEGWDALDLRQWQFHILPYRALRQHGYKSMSLNTVQRVCGGPLTAAEFQDAAHRVIDEVAANPALLSPRVEMMEALV